MGWNVNVNQNALEKPKCLELGKPNLSTKDISESESNVSHTTSSTTASDSESAPTSSTDSKTTSQPAVVYNSTLNSDSVISPSHWHQITSLLNSNSSFRLTPAMLEQICAEAEDMDELVALLRELVLGDSNLSGSESVPESEGSEGGGE